MTFLESLLSISIAELLGYCKLKVHCWRCLLLFLSLHQGTPLHVAAEEGNTDTVKCLAGMGAVVNITNKDGVSDETSADSSLLLFSRYCNCPVFAGTAKDGKRQQTVRVHGVWHTLRAKATYYLVLTSEF